MLRVQPNRVDALFSANFSYPCWPIAHYATPDALRSIINNRTLRFTDCQFFEDRTEFIHALDILSVAMDEVRGRYEPEFLACLYADNRPIYETRRIITSERVGRDGIINIDSEELSCRHFVFCTTALEDDVYLWDNYSGRDGFRLSLDLPALRFWFSPEGANRFENCIFEFGRVLYDDRPKVDLLKDLIAIEHDTWSFMNQSPAVVQRDFEGHFNKIRLLIKRPEFSPEAEIRIVASIPTANLRQDIVLNSMSYGERDGRPFIDVRFPTESLYSVKAGPAVTEDSLNEAIELLSQNDVLCDVERSRIAP